MGVRSIEDILVAGFTPMRWRSTGYAIKFVLNFGTGSTVVHMTGHVKTRFALEPVYGFLAGVAILLVLSIIGLTVVSRRVPHVRT